MSYEVAQQVLDQLAIATQLFTAGYMGTAFTVYAWKRSAEPVKVPFSTPLSLPQATALEAIERTSESLPTQAIALSLPEPKWVE